VRARLPALALVVVAGCGPRDAGPPGGTCAPPPPRPEALVVAGSGTNLALARALAARFTRDDPSLAVEVPESLGTSGAVAALRDGAIDVGLASRPLRPEELEGGVAEVPLARVAHALVVHARTGVERISQDEVVRLIRGEQETWPDGSPAVVLLREHDDSGNRLLRARWPEVGRAIDAALDGGRWPVCTTDQEMRDLLLRLDGALGFLDTGTIRLEGLPLKPLAVPPRHPDAADYPAIKRLSLLVGPQTDDRGRRFVELATSRQVAEVLARGGYGAPDPGR